MDESGSSGALGKHYEIDAIPQSILLDKEGRIIGVGLTAKEVEEIINKAIW